MKPFILAIFCAAAAAGLLLAQTPKDSLADLIEAGNRKAALDKIRAGADVNEAQPDGTRPIHWAVYRVDYEILDALIAKKARVDVSNEFVATPLGEAVLLADARMVKTLLAAGARPDTPTQDGQTPLMLAVKTGELPIVEMLVKAGANVNAQETFHKQTVLMWAAAAPKNAGAMVKLLLSKDADVRPRSLYSDWPSQISSEPRAQYKPVGGLTALMYAARSGCYDCVESLLGTGASPNVPSPEGVTPLMIALDDDNLDIAKLLLERGANPKVWDWWGRTALYIAIDRKDGGSSGGIPNGARVRPPAPVARHSSGPAVSYMAMINMLLAAGVNVNAQLNMHRPSRGGNSGRFIEEYYNTGCTPLLRAVIGNDLEVARSLLDKGASPNVTAMGVTPFLVAAGIGTGRGTGLTPAGGANLVLMDLLLKHGADVNAQATGTTTYSLRMSRAAGTNEGMTALHIAAQTGRTDLVRYLLEKGAKTEIVDSNGHKPIDLVGAGGAGVAGPQAPAASATPQATITLPVAGRGGGGANTASAAELRALLQNAAAKK